MSRHGPMLALIGLLAGCPAAATTETEPPDRGGKFALERPRPTTPPGMLACTTRELSSDVGGWPSSMVLADINGDGALDVAVEYGSKGSSYVSIQLNDGEGRLREASATRVAAFSYALGAADLDGDGRVELFTNDYRGSRIALFATTVSGEVRGPMPIRTTFRPGGINPHDTDGDGDLDLVVSSLRHIQVFENRGGLRFAKVSPIAIRQAPDEVVAADLDGDGRAELAVVANDSSKLYSLAIGPRNRLAIKSVSPTCAKPSVTQTADLDGDGRGDLAFHCTGEFAVRLAGGETRTFASPNIDEMGLGDLDGDGDVDVIGAGRKCATCGSDIRFYENDGHARFTERSSMHVDGHVKMPTIADVDRDGSPDLVVAVWPGRAPGRVSVFLGGACQ